MSVILANLGLILGGLAILLLIVIIATGYVKAPPDTAFIISGLRKKTVIGKSSITQQQVDKGSYVGNCN